MARGVEDVAGESGYTVVYCNTDESESKEEKYANLLAQRTGRWCTTGSSLRQCEDNKIPGIKWSYSCGA